MASLDDRVIELNVYCPHPLSPFLQRHTDRLERVREIRKSQASVYYRAIAKFRMSYQAIENET